MGTNLAAPSMSKRCAPRPGLNLPRMSLPSSIALRPRMSRVALALVGLAGDGLLHPLRSGRPHPHLAVVEDGGVARPHLGGDHPHVFLGVGVHHHVLVVDGAARRQLERLRHLEDDIRLDVPAAGELDRRRRVLLVAGRGARVGPRAQQLDLRRAQAALVGEVAVGRVGEPRRHLLRRDGGLDCLGPRPRLLVGEQRHRRHLAGPVARLAVGLEDWQHVLVERGGIGRRGLSRTHQHRDNGRREQSHGHVSSKAIYDPLSIEDQAATLYS